MSDKKEESNTSENWAIALVALVYAGAIIVATVFFISYIIGVIDDTRYGTRAVMALGGILVGLSSIAFPISLHTWINGKTHRIITYVLYTGEIIFIGFNVIVSFTSLGAIEKGLEIPLWMQSYEPYSVLSIAYVAAAWAIILAANPAYKVKRKSKENKQKLVDDRQRLQDERDAMEIEKERLIFQQEKAFIVSYEGEEYLSGIAKENIEVSKNKRNKQKKQHFGTRRPAMATDTAQTELDPNA